MAVPDTFASRNGASRNDNNTDRAATESIAKDTDTSIEVVQEIYEQELSSLASEAKITQYLGVLTTRRVRMLLRRH